MSPRPTPTRYDPTAMRILDAAAELIDASLSEASDDLPPRLRSIHFPAALDWIRIEDITRVLSGYQPTISKKAIVNRWGSKEELVHDAALHCILYRDRPAGGTPDATPEFLVAVAMSAGLARAITVTADTIMSNLVAASRTFLLMHLAPMLPRHPEIQRQIAADGLRVQQEWAQGYRQLMTAYGVVLRPEWTMERLGLAVQLLLDGHLLRTRIDPQLIESARWESTSIFATAVVTLIVGAIDHDRSGLTAADYLDSITSLQVDQIRAR